MKNNSTKKILLVAKHQLIAEGLALILRDIGDEVSLTICSDEHAPLKSIDRLKLFDLILVDLNRPYFSGFGFKMAMQAQKTGIPVIFIAESERKDELENALSLGSAVFISKASSSEELIRTAMQLLNSKYRPPIACNRRKNRYVTAKSTQRITTRQMQVLELLREGLQNKQIALALNISAYSVKDHVTGLFRHFQVNNRTLCVQVALDQRVI